MSTTTISSARSRATAGDALPQRNAPGLPTAQRHPFRVLHTNHAPAQLSLFLRPAITKR